jgi:hypothetical protein
VLFSSESAAAVVPAMVGLVVGPPSLLLWLVAGPAIKWKDREDEGQVRIRGRVQGEDRSQAPYCEL